MLSRYYAVLIIARGSPRANRNAHVSSSSAFCEIAGEMVRTLSRAVAVTSEYRVARDERSQGWAWLFRFVGIADDRLTIRGGSALSMPPRDDKLWRNKGDKRTEMETTVEDRGTVYTARRTVKIKRKINCWLDCDSFTCYVWGCLRHRGKRNRRISRSVRFKS